MIPDGVNSYESDPTAYRIALEAKQAYWTLNPHLRLISTGVRVTQVWKEPGHCHDPRPEDESGEYRAEVRGLLWFGIPGPRVYVQSGDWYYSKSQ